ncbi:UNVERIFIED_CONTAM: Transmembrane protein 14C [Gekko kuhli]
MQAPGRINLEVSSINLQAVDFQTRSCSLMTAGALTDDELLSEEAALERRLRSPPSRGMSVDWIGYGYAALVASGGVIGYAKAGSVPSLAAGLLFGGLAGLGTYQQSQDPKNIWLSLIASGTLTGVMGMRFYNSRKFMPAGLIAGASLLMVGRLAVQMMEKPLQP